MHFASDGSVIESSDQVYYELIGVNKQLQKTKEFRGIGSFIFVCKHAHQLKLNAIQIRNLISHMKIHSLTINCNKEENSPDYHQKYQ